MGIEINFDFASFVNNFMIFASKDPISMAWDMLWGGLWVIFLLPIIYGLYLVWLDSRQGQYYKKWDWVLLAIDIPKENEQTPKAVESIFNAVAGAHTSPTWWDAVYKGRIQESFSFEIVSLEGYIQFLIRTPVHFRDLIEAAIYAQYPEAEITEVEDYTEEFKDLKFPNDKYKLWGTEFVFLKPHPYPIRTYEEFEHGLTQTFLDPMADLLEIMSRISREEYVWVQLVVTPLKSGWGEGAKKVVKELSGEPYSPPTSTSAKIISAPADWLVKGVGAVAGALTTSEASQEMANSEDQWKMFRITPGERAILERIEKKLAKRGFAFKFRFIYFGDKDNFNKGRGVSAIVGAVNQFSTTDSNGFKPGKRTKTQANYYFIKKRLADKQNKLFRQYITRTNYYGEDNHELFMNTEELASVWHFPAMTVKAPTLEKTASRKVVAPSRLPIAESREATLKRPLPQEPVDQFNSPISNPPKQPSVDESFVTQGNHLESNKSSDNKPTPPPNLPVV